MEAGSWAWFKAKKCITPAISLYVLAVFIGLYNCMYSGWLVVIGFLGELFSGLLMGTTGFVLSSFFIQTNTISILVLAINVRDIDSFINMKKVCTGRLSF